MKQIILKLKKCFCLMLSILLITPNGVVFAQEAPLDAAISEDLTVLSGRVQDLTEHFNVLEQNRITILNRDFLDFQDFQNLLNEYEEHFKEIQRICFGWSQESFAEKSLYDYIDSYQKYLEQRASKDLTERLGYKYATKEELETMINVSEQIMPKENIVLPKFQDFLSSMNEKISKMDPAAFEELPITDIFSTRQLNQWEEFHNYVNELINKYHKTLDNTWEFNQKLSKELFEDLVSPQDVMKYAYKHNMLPKEKAGIKLALEAIDSEVSVQKLATGIRTYLKPFGGKMQKMPNLAADLAKMSAAERAKYVDDLLELKPGPKMFIEDFSKLDKPAQEILGKSIGALTVAAGAILIMNFIMDISAENSFEYAADFTAIQDNIERGKASLTEMVAFYSEEGNESLIVNNPTHTLNAIRTYAAANAVENILKNVNKGQENQNVENNFLELYKNQKQTENLGTGNL